ncbi:MAG: hypothetical protein OEQ25_18075 [Gammaproteobacteria bacterium]|nr:hypothetical protein [Gammaproteobacteria bacterium]MDH3509052.1 hypothetical protein [Gammaproteobacteria bacterium]
MRLCGPTTLILLLTLGGCAPVEVTYEPEYLEAAVPSYLAETQILVLMEDQDNQYVFEGPPESFVGQGIDLRIPLGAITREITAGVFRSHFNYGVVFADEMPDYLPYIIAIEPEITGFSYRYDQFVDETVMEMQAVAEGFEPIPVTVITPSIQFELDIVAYDTQGNLLLEKTYPSGLVAGESYIVTSRPHERINATFHATLQEIMLEVADDLRPLLATHPNIFDPE